MKNRKIELDYFRAFLCILIILVHLITQYMNNIGDNDTNELKLVYYIQNIIIFGTPCFIILSQMLTTMNYNKLTLNYLWSRFKYIVIPYFLIGLFYCYSESLKTNSNFSQQIWNNLILGDWYGYFIMIIVQYAILSYLIYKISYKIFNSKLMLIVSFVVQVAFLYLLHNNTDFAHNFHHIYPLSDNTFILGWIFYFFLGSYIGLNYDRVCNFLKNYLFIIIGLAACSFIGFIFLFKHDYWNVTSYSDELTLYNSFMFLLLLGISLHFEHIVKYSINLVSAFSYFIYLFHPIILDVIYKYTSIFDSYTIPFLALSLLFILGICVGVGIFLREFKIMRFLIGKQPFKLNID